MKGRSRYRSRVPPRSVARRHFSISEDMRRETLRLDMSVLRLHFPKTRLLSAFSHRSLCGSALTPLICSRR
jgi:hypothetical protein